MAQRSASRGNVAAAAATEASLVCADCGAADPGWASLNRGVLLCAECANVHRGLGRHVSQVRSLRRGAWPGDQLTLVRALYAAGANNVWEHQLLDPNGAARFRRKPSPRDPVYPAKSEFVRAKYAAQAFALRPASEEAAPSPADLGRQLCSCVRSAHVDTALRLLALGADANFVDAGRAPLHVAAREGQSLQVELLAVYGADPCLPDADGRTAAEVARRCGHAALSQRLVELRYEATDRLSAFLCGRRPEHGAGQHFVIPEMAMAVGAAALFARRRLQELPDESFVRLLADVHDEVDRRETDEAWRAQLGAREAALVADQYIVPFLPVDPALAATRNQCRQKLAKLGARHFAALLIDLLADARRRDAAARADDGDDGDARTDDVARPLLHSLNDEPELDYDSVAGSAEEVGRSPADAPIAVTLDDLMEMRQQLAASESKLERLADTNEKMLQQLSAVQEAVERVSRENGELRDQVKLAAESASARPPVSEKAAVRGSAENLAKLADNARTQKHPARSSLPLLDLPPPAPQRSTRVRRKESLSSPPAVASAADYDEPQTGEQEEGEGAVAARLVAQTEQLTAAIKRLLGDAQTGATGRFAERARDVRACVDTMVRGAGGGAAHDACLGRMVDACIALTVRCGEVPARPPDVVQAAYDVAKAAKQLLALIQHR